MGRKVSNVLLQDLEERVLEAQHACAARTTTKRIVCLVAWCVGQKQTADLS